MSLDFAIRPGSAGSDDTEARLIALVLDGLTSEHPPRRAYRTGLERFFVWIWMEGQRSGFTKATVQRYRAKLIAAGLSASTVNLRLDTCNSRCRAAIPTH